MKKFLQLLIVAAAMFMCAESIQAITPITGRENARRDDNNNPVLISVDQNAATSTLYMVGGDPNTRSINVNLVGLNAAATNSINIVPPKVGDYDYLTYSVPATSNSGANLDCPASTTAAMRTFASSS